MSKSTANLKPENSPVTFEDFKNEVLQDYRIAFESRQASLLGRKEVLTGKAKFGIFGDGKEVAQLAMAKAFKNGDIRSGYYRDQTFMFATGMSDVRKFFAQLYAHVSLEAEPASAGRLMNGHFASRFLDDQGQWKDLTAEPHSTSDISPTAGQMGRALGIAFASKLYRNNPDLQQFTQFSKQGNEVSFVTIGNASTSEGHFWETINAAGVLQVPLAVNIWDDQYGISVPAKYQTTKENLSDILSGFATNENGNGFRIYTAKGWDYPTLCETYLTAIEEMRSSHMPAIFHITEVTQPQGHSTSGSHERYKSPERLAWEQEHDCLVQMRKWMLAQGISSESELESIEKEATAYVKTEQKAAYQAFRSEIEAELQEALRMIDAVMASSANTSFVSAVRSELASTIDPIRKDIMGAIRRTLRICRHESSEALEQLRNFKYELNKKHEELYSSYLYSESAGSALKQTEIAPVFTDNSAVLNGYEILNKAFDSIFQREPRFFAIGEDVGKIGDVNQGFSGMQDKHGEIRISDTGIREMTIVGQGFGAAMRGLRPLVEIQYLDYLLYAIQIMSDDIATLQYRTKGGQKAPLIIRTRGHRLEGIWHSGSPIGMILNSIRGMHLLVPRNMVQAVGFYNLLLKSDEPALVIECLNGYRLKETMPDNLESFTVPLGKPETLREGDDITIITYGSCCRIALDAAKQLAETGINAEVIDIQSLLPFDLDHDLIKSVKKTNRFLILDEDVPGGASAFIFQHLMEEQGAYFWLDSPGRTLTAKAHRPAYGTDGDYFSKPSVDDVVETVYNIMSETDPSSFPKYL
ncbi:MAG: thiamine pyrophosphate-dependent enzyme [Sphingobacteriaceae bacterium]|nr:thiamine pyrophosphate-dependent enzyme [Sphingobacteriaceae bacterium]